MTGIGTPAVARTLISTIVVAAATLVPFQAHAQARPDARELACSETRELVFQRGAITITTGENRFERFVEGQRHCQPVDEISTPAFVATRDNPQCWVGYVCRNHAELNADR